MSFTKVWYLALRANAPRSLTVRSLYAQEMMKLLDQGYRVINCDQSWLNESDFRRHRWNRKGGLHSQPKHVVSPRLSVFAGIDTAGEAFVSLSTVTTRSEEVCLFLKWLMFRLQVADKDWKKKTVLLLDGASYHRSKETRTYLANHGVKVVVGGPYGFEAAPIEHLFGALKCVDLNPAGVRTNKR